MPASVRTVRAPRRLIVWATAVLTAAAQVTVGGMPDPAAAQALSAPADGSVQRAADKRRAVLKRLAEQPAASPGRSQRTSRASADIDKSLAADEAWPTPATVTARGRKPLTWGGRRADERPEFPTDPTGPPRLT